VIDAGCGIGPCSAPLQEMNSKDAQRTLIKIMQTRNIAVKLAQPMPGFHLKKFHLILNTSMLQLC